MRRSMRLMPMFIYKDKIKRKYKDGAVGGL